MPDTNENTSTGRPASVEDERNSYEREEFSLEQEIDHIAEHSPKVAELLRRVAKFHA